MATKGNSLMVRHQLALQDKTVCISTFVYIHICIYPHLYISTFVYIYWIVFDYSTVGKHWNYMVSWVLNRNVTSSIYWFPCRKDRRYRNRRPCHWELCWCSGYRSLFSRWLWWRYCGYKLWCVDGTMCSSCWSTRTEIDKLSYIYKYIHIRISVYIYIMYFKACLN